MVQSDSGKWDSGFTHVHNTEYMLLKSGQSMVYINTATVNIINNDTYLANDDACLFQRMRSSRSCKTAGFMIHEY